MIWLRVAVPALAFVAAAILMLPMRMAWAAAPRQGDLAIEQVEGTVWSAKLGGVTWRGLSLGDFRAALSPTSFAQPVLKLSEGTGPIQKASLHLGNGATQLSDVALDLPLADLFASIREPAKLHVRDADLVLTERGCLEASARLSTDAAPSLGLPGFEGKLGCEQGALTASLASRDGIHKVVLAITADFTNMSVREASAEAALVLSAMGLSQAAPVTP